MKKLIRNERGELTYFTVFVVLAINILLAFLLLFASVKINCINIRNAAKMELNNVSARIYADTFHSQREANLDSYMSDLNFSRAYQRELRLDFIEGLESRIALDTDDYTISNIKLQFREHDDRIEYVVTCEAQFRIQMFGNMLPPITRQIELSGSHNTKY